MLWNMLSGLTTERAQFEMVAAIQQSLFDVGGELSMGHPGLLDESSLEALEEASATLLSGLKPLAEFVMPRGAKIVCQAHICRTACREAEVAMVQAKDAGFNVSAEGLKYINRLSDYLFNLARHLDHSKEVLWARKK
jgi:cob(I)alamin adenosyltransferase